MHIFWQIKLHIAPRGCTDCGVADICHLLRQCFGAGHVVHEKHQRLVYGHAELREDADRLIDDLGREFEFHAAVVFSNGSYRHHLRLSLRLPHTIVAARTIVPCKNKACGACP